MTEKRHSYRAELVRLMDALADAAVEASDEAILAEAREAGSDPAAEAERVRAVLLRAVRAKQTEPLRKARRQYEAEAARLKTKAYHLPETAAQRRQLLFDFLAARPQMQSMVTVQFRELDQLSDADIEISLKKLAELGLLHEGEGNSEKK